MKRWTVSTVGVVALLYFVWRLLKSRLHRRSTSLDAQACEYARSTCDEPEYLFVVCNGFMGSTSSGRHVVDVVMERSEGRAVAAVRVQAADILSGVNLYSEGVERARDAVVASVERQRQRWPSLQRVSLLGSSYGGLVLRECAPSLLAAGWRLEGLVCMCSPHSGAAQLQPWRALVALLPVAILKELLAGSRGQGVLATLGQGCEASFRVRVAVGSPHDTTVPLANALLGFPLPVEQLSSAPLSPSSLVLLQHVAGPDPVPSAGHDPRDPPADAIATRLRRAGPWTLLVTSGRHNDDTRAFSSPAVWGRIVDLIHE
jgi:hypothetical protein